jgi:ribulose-phosphate 3-epimerase
MDWGKLGKSLEESVNAGADYLHYDVGDSYFSPEFGMPLHLVEKITSQTHLPLDLHLMVEEPRRIFEWLPSSPTRVTIHYEACRNLHRDLVALRQFGHRPGLALNPGTNLDLIEYVIEEIDYALIMTSNPGFPDQKMTPQVLRKIERLRDWRDESGRSLQIAVDGDVSLDNVTELVTAGAELLTLPQNVLEDASKLTEAIEASLTPGTGKPASSSL